MDSFIDITADNSSSRRDINTRPLTKNAKKNKKRHEKRKQLLQEQQRSNPLPVKKHEVQIADTVRNNQVTIITAETGCGKSSQVPQILLRDVLRNVGVIVCTQPRRVAAWSVATRVAEEMNVELGQEVGYHVRFDNKTCGRTTAIKYVTDGILLRECLFNQKVVENYSIIIIDEVHERSIQMDLLFVFMKMMLPKHPDLKLVIMSATMATDEISQYFGRAPVLKLDGTLKHHVDLCYRPGFTNAHILTIITEIVDNNKDGDILVFLPGEPEIIQLRKVLEKLKKSLCVLPVHSQLPPWKIERIFQRPPDGHRKVILATNIAESSITVEGLRFVVDSGYVNVKVFDAETGVQQLETRLISKSEAQQRRGRIGRTCPGFCVRLYSKEQLKSSEEGDEEKCETERCFRDFPTPQIEREDLTHLMLMLKWVTSGCSIFETDIDNLPWLTKPNPVNVAAAMTDLVRLGALDTKHTLTETGRHIVKFPLHPRMAAVILKCTKRGSEYGAMLLAAILSAFNGGRQRSLLEFWKSRDEQVLDEVTGLIHIMHEFLNLECNDHDGEKVHDFANRFKISPHHIYETVHVYKQLARVMKTCDRDALTHAKCKGYSPNELVVPFDIGEVLIDVFASNVGKRLENGEFKLPRGLDVLFRPTLPTSPSRNVSKVGGIELFCLKDIRKQRTDLKPRMVNTFIPKNQ